VPTGQCLDVSCKVDEPIAGPLTITMVVNDDGNGGRVTIECNYDNNTDSIPVESCDIPR
jgi:hypothetical protein